MCEGCKKAEAKITVEVKNNEVEMRMVGNNAGLVRAFASIFASAKEDPKLAQLLSVAVDNADMAQVMKTETITERR